MSTSRLFSVFVVLALVVLAVLTLRAGIVTSEVVSSGRAALDQHERHPVINNPSAAAVAEQARLEYRRGEWYAGYSPSAAELAEQARLEYRRGEWTAGDNFYAPLDAHERHASANTAAEQARLDYRRGEWNAGSNVASPEFDVEQARIQWRAGK